MAAATNKQQKGRNQNVAGKTFSCKRIYDSFGKNGLLRSILVDPAKLIPIACLIVFAEVVINLAVVNCVKYTEIDWRAYMQEVESVLNGTFDYSLVRGDTGPLVYPAGFVWIFSCFYFLTNRGENILLAQYLYAFIYLLNLILVLRIYSKSKKVPPYVLALTCLTSYRIHSIFVLRLFNDPIAILFLHASLNAFLDSKWSLGSLLYSLAVSVKMNVLLYAPSLLLAYLTCLGPIRTIQQLLICAGLQIFLASPFLLSSPLNYLKGAFDFGRVFLHEWTVNWRFLPEEIFTDRRFHVCLLAFHLFFLAVFYRTSRLHFNSYAKLKSVEEEVKKSRPDKKSTDLVDMTPSTRLFLLPMFLSNFIGIVFSRSLHYQFYVWYFHSLPFLLWSTNYSTPTRLFILGIIELCWNTFPSTSLSSLSLHSCHLAVLYGIYRSQLNLMERVGDSRAKEKKKL